MKNIPESAYIVDANTESNNHIKRWEKQRNYKEIYDLKNLSLDSIYDDSGMYLKLTYDMENIRDEKETEEQIKQDLAEVEQVQQEILEKIPNVNLMIGVDFGHREDKYSYFYKSGERVYPKPNKRHENYSDEQIIDFEEFAFRKILVKSSYKDSLFGKLLSL